MLRVNEMGHDGYLVELVPDSHRLSSNNVYTVIVGKNGVGKSRLLANIAKAGIEFAEYDGTYIKYPLLHFDRESQVIAVSTSPFDKFPTPPRGRRDGRYQYVGMRGDNRFSASSAITLISSASKGLLSKIIKNANNADFLEVFKSLSFSPQVDFIFKPAFSRSPMEVTRSSNSSQMYFEVDTPDGENRLKVDLRFQRTYENLSTEDKSSVSYAMSNIASYFHERKAIDLSIDFETNSVVIDNRHADPHIINSILILMNIGLIRLMDLRIYKDEYGMLSLRRASSGEQCLIVLMLGIAGHIEDGSLILIDEPEISLHPRWQEQFMQMLIRSFSRYQYCHFVIATHSPQVVSKIDADDAFVLSLPSGELHPGVEFYNKSADYQLAELFDAPGIMNEYISRISFNLIAKIRSRQSVNEEITAELHRLIKFREILHITDPVRDLIASVEELVLHYANHK